MMVKYILDLLVIVFFFDGNNIIDVGMGFGFLGMLLVIVFLDKLFILFDLLGKCVWFMI